MYGNPKIVPFFVKRACPVLYNMPHAVPVEGKSCALCDNSNRRAAISIGCIDLGCPLSPRARLE